MDNFLLLDIELRLAYNHNLEIIDNIRNIALLQLTTCEPLIRKDEREKICRFIETQLPSILTLNFWEDIKNGKCYH